MLYCVIYYHLILPIVFYWKIHFQNNACSSSSCSCVSCMHVRVPTHACVRPYHSSAWFLKQSASVTSQNWEHGDLSSEEPAALISAVSKWDRNMWRRARVHHTTVLPVFGHTWLMCQWMMKALIYFVFYCKYFID